MAGEKETKRQYSRRSPKSLRDISIKQMGKDFRKPLFAAAGFVGAAQLSKLLKNWIDKDNAVSGLLGIDKEKAKEILPAAVSGAIGLGAHQLVGNENIKLAGVGAGAYGIVQTVNLILGKDILNGLGGIGQPEQQALTVVERIVEKPQESYELPLYEIDEPSDPNPYLESIINQSDLNGEELKGSSEKEVILSSGNPEDNFEVETNLDNGPEVELDEIETIEAIPEVKESIQRMSYTASSDNEELDFDNIP